MTSHYDQAVESMSHDGQIVSRAGIQALATLALVDELRGLRTDLTTRAEQATPRQAPMHLPSLYTPIDDPEPRVGDALTGPDQLDALPLRAVVIDPQLDAWQKLDAVQWFMVGDERAATSIRLTNFDTVTLAWLPPTDGAA